MHKKIILFTLGVFTITVFFAWYSVNPNNTDVVFAQNPYPLGCYTLTANETDCYGGCEYGGFTSEVGVSTVLVNKQQRL